MPRLLLFCACQTALIDSATNAVSIISLIEQASVPRFPANLPDLAIVAIWRRYEEEAEASMIQRVVLLDPTRTVLATVETPFVFERIGHRIVNRVTGLPIHGPGMHEFAIYVTHQGSEFPENPATTYPIQVQQAFNLQVGNAPQTPGG